MRIPNARSAGDITPIFIPQSTATSIHHAAQLFKQFLLDGRGSTVVITGAGVSTGKRRARSN